MSFDDIIKRNRRALGQPETPSYVEPTANETAVVRCCPRCRAEVKMVGVERLAAQTGLLRSTRYNCLPCMRAFGVPNPATLAFLLLGGLVFLLFALFTFTNTVISVEASDRTPIGIGLLVLGGITFLWGLLGVRTASASMPRPAPGRHAIPMPETPSTSSSQSSTSATHRVGDTTPR